MADSRRRRGMRWLLAAFYLAAGLLHLARPEGFMAIVPDWVPAHRRW